MVRKSKAIKKRSPKSRPAPEPEEDYEDESDDASPGLGPDSANVSRIFDFIRGISLDPKGLGGKPGGLVLRTRAGVGGPSEPVQEFLVDPHADEEVLHDLAVRIALVAETEAEGQGGGEWPFAIYAIRDGERTPFGKRAFSVLIEGRAYPGEMGASDHPTTQGMVAQYQRHVEKILQTQNQAVQGMMHSFHTVMQVTTQRMEAMERMGAETFELARANVMQREEREARLAAEQRREKRMDQIFGKLAEVAPMIMAAVMAHMQQGQIPANVPEAPREPQEPESAEASFLPPSVLATEQGRA